MIPQTDRVNEVKPNWMIEYEESNARAMAELKELVERIENKIDPVVDAYTTAGTLGRWSKVAGTSLLLILSIWWAIISIKSSNTFTWIL